MWLKIRKPETGGGNRVFENKALLKLAGIAFGVLFGLGLIAAMAMGLFGSEKVANAIAVVEVKGEISGGQSGGSVFGSAYAGSETMMQKIRMAARDENIRALILHINSPGGSAPASEEVYMEVLRFKRETGKPVLAVMADVAASGGYFIAMGADEIFANPATMTGSIGVIMQFKNYAGLYEKYGVKMETIRSGKYKDIGNPGRPMRADERELLQTMVDQIYDRFVDAVVKGRNMPRERVLELAQGQIYTGMQAKELNLVDHLGNFYDAVDYLSERVSIKGQPQLVYYTKAPGLLERMLGGLARITVPVLGNAVQPTVPTELMLLEESLLAPGLNGMTIRY